MADMGGKLIVAQAHESSSELISVATIGSELSNMPPPLNSGESVFRISCQVPALGTLIG